MHLSLFRTSAARRARVSQVCDCFFLLSRLRLGSGWVGGSLEGSRNSLLLVRAMAYGALARGRFRASFRVLATSRLSLPVRVAAVSPRELSPGPPRCQRGVPPRPGAVYQILWAWSRQVLADVSAAVHRQSGRHAREFWMTKVWLRAVSSRVASSLPSARVFWDLECLVFVLLVEHALASLLWKRQFEKSSVGTRMRKVTTNWDCLFVHRQQGLFLSVYVDNKKLDGKKLNLDLTWKKLMKHVDLESPRRFLITCILGDAFNANANLNEGLIDECTKIFESAGVSQSYQNRRKVVQTLLRGRTTWKDMRRNAWKQIAHLKCLYLVTRLYLVTHWQSRHPVVGRQIGTSSHKMDKGLWETLGSFDGVHAQHEWLEATLSCGTCITALQIGIVSGSRFCWGSESSQSRFRLHFGYVRIKLEFHTVLLNLRFFLWMPVSARIVFPLLISGIWLSKS